MEPGLVRCTYPSHTKPESFLVSDQMIRRADMGRASGGASRMKRGGMATGSCVWGGTRRGTFSSCEESVGMLKSESESESDEGLRSRFMRVIRRVLYLAGAAMDMVEARVKNCTSKLSPLGAWPFMCPVKLTPESRTNRTVRPCHAYPIVQGPQGRREKRRGHPRPKPYRPGGPGCIRRGRPPIGCLQSPHAGAPS